MKKKWGAALCVLLMALAMTLFSCASAKMTSEIPLFAAYGETPEAGSGDAARMISYTVFLHLQVKDPAESKTLSMGEIESHNGYILQETSRSFTARIPAENMDAFLVKMKVLGSVDREDKTGTDITERYRNDGIRLESLKEVRGRYQALLEMAKTVEEILRIERELERVNTEIEILERKKQAAELSVQYASISVYFDRESKPGPFGWVFYGLYRGIRWLFIWD